MRVAAEPALAPPASPITNGRGSRPRCTSPAQSIGVIANTTTSLASTAESTPAVATVDASRATGEAVGRGDPRRAPVVEAADGELRRQDHQPEQDDDRRHVDGREHCRPVHGIGGVEHDRAQQRDAGAIDPQPRPAADRHPDVDGEKTSRTSVVKRVGSPHRSRPQGDRVRPLIGDIQGATVAVSNSAGIVISSTSRSSE